MLINCKEHFVNMISNYSEKCGNSEKNHISYNKIQILKDLKTFLDSYSF